MQKANNRFYLPVALAISLLLAYIVGIIRLSWFIQNDTLWHLKAGEYMVNNKTILTHDVFSWTMPGVHWYSHEWLWEIIVYLIYKKFGFAGLFWSSIPILALYFFIGLQILKTAATKILFIITSVMGWAIYGYFVARTLVPAAVLFALTLFILTRYQKLNTKHLLILGLTFLIWANFHASVVVGVFFTALFAAMRILNGENYKEAIKPVATAAITSLINPHHIGIYTFFIKLTTARTLTDTVNEWLPPNFHENPLLIFALVWITTFVIANRLESKWWQNLIVFLVGFAMFLSAIRNIVLTGLIFGIACQSSDREERQDEKWLGVFILALVTTFLLSVNLNRLQLVDEKTMLKQDWAKPFKAVDFMQQHGYTDRVLNDYELGAYLIFRNIKCSVDSRGDMYYLANPKITEQYIQCLGLRDHFEKLIKIYKPRYVWVGARRPTALYLEAKGYKLLYEDRYTALFQVPEGMK